MRVLTNNDVQQISGAGESYSIYFSTQLPLTILPVLVDQANNDNFDINQFVQAVRDAGIDPNSIKFDFSICYGEY